MITGATKSPLSRRNCENNPRVVPRMLASVIRSIGSLKRERAIAAARQARRTRPICWRRHHRPSRARTIAGLSVFLTLIQSLDGPER
jgi:hypothetical protein